jgi:hypothetical protein
VSAVSRETTSPEDVRDEGSDSSETAKKLGRKWFGIDDDPDKVLNAHERIQAATA